MALPFLIGAAVIGAIGAAVASSSSSGNSNNDYDDDDDYGERARKEIVDQTSAYLKSNYKRVLDPLIKVGLCEEYSDSYNAEVFLYDDIDDFIYEGDVEQLYFATEDFSIAETAFEALEWHYYDLHNAGSLASVHYQLASKYLNCTKKFNRHIELIAQIQSVRSKIEQLMEDPETDIDDYDL